MPPVLSKALALSGPHFPRGPNGVTVPSHGVGAAAELEVCERAVWGARSRGGCRASPASRSPPPPARRPPAGVDCSERPRLGRANQHARAGSSAGRRPERGPRSQRRGSRRPSCPPGPAQARRAAGGRGPAPGGAPRVGPAGPRPSPAARPPGGAIAKRLLPSGGGAGAAAAPRGQAGPGRGVRGRGAGGAPGSPTPLHSGGAPGAPARWGLGEGQCSAEVGAWAPEPGSPHPSWVARVRSLQPLNPVCPSAEGLTSPCLAEPLQGLPGQTRGTPRAHGSSVMNTSCSPCKIPGRPADSVPLTLPPSRAQCKDRSASLRTGAPGLTGLRGRPPPRAEFSAETERLSRKPWPEPGGCPWGLTDGACFPSFPAKPLPTVTDQRVQSRAMRSYPFPRRPH